MNNTVKSSSSCALRWPVMNYSEALRSNSLLHFDPIAFGACGERFNYVAWWKLRV